MSDFIYTRSVPFADTDAAGVVHFSRILCYVEESIHAYLQDSDVAVHSPQSGWPLVKVDVDYRRPIRFGAQLEIQVEPFSLGRSSVSWSFAVAEGEAMVAEGIITTVHVDGGGQSQELPEILRSKVNT